MTYFNPDDVDAYPVNERVLVTGLEVDNRPVEIGKKINNQIILNEGVSFINKIVLDNDNRDFSLTFNNLSYSKEQRGNCFEDKDTPSLEPYNAFPAVYPTCGNWNGGLSCSVGKGAAAASGT